MRLVSTEEGWGGGSASCMQFDPAQLVNTQLLL